jgi:hypothetical protein
VIITLPNPLNWLKVRQEIPDLTQAGKYDHALDPDVSEEPSNSAKAVESNMASFQSVVLEGAKDVEVGIADAVKIFAGAASKAPAAVTSLTALAGAVDKALADVTTAAGSPATLVITLPTDVADFKAIWADGKTLLASIGVK